MTDFVWPVRVYYEDTDAGGVVFYANYLKYYERARTEWLRAKGFSQHELLETDQLAFVVRQVEVNYLRPARLDDELNIEVVVKKVGKARIELEQRIVLLNNLTLLNTARVVLACVDAEKFKPCAIPEKIRQEIA